MPENPSSKTSNKSIGSAIKKSHIRYDLEIIANLIEPKSKVLDIGCGAGELLKYLKEVKKVDGRGLEISHKDVSAAVKSGLSIIQGDAENDLAYYPDRSFDYAILSQTIQAMKNPKEVIEQMLRVSEFAIISLPNFAYYKNRLYLLFKGKMPVSETMPYQWFDTPNIHFCSIKDFEKLCTEMNFIIRKKISLTNKGKLAGTLEGKIMANFFAEYGIFLITKNELAMNAESELTFEKQKELFSMKPALTNPAYNNSRHQ